jgi:hypothetical protein
VKKKKSFKNSKETQNEIQKKANWAVIEMVFISSYILIYHPGRKEEFFGKI